MAYRQNHDQEGVTARGHEQVLPGLGSGIYTYYEAAKLLGVDKTQVRRWADGYTYSLRGEQKHKEPVLQRQRTPEGLLTFYDLIELFIVRELIRAGVRMEVIRASAALLSRELDTPYPFACEKIYTDGVQILHDAGDQYENVATKQQVFQFIEDFFKNMEFDRNYLPMRWFPLGPERLIVMDPKRSFGTPIDFRSGMRTDVLYSTYKAEEDIDAVADWYEVTREAVEAAVEFEEQWKKAA